MHEQGVLTQQGAPGFPASFRGRQTTRFPHVLECRASA
jgi:hypothetical protein